LRTRLLISTLLILCASCIAVAQDVHTDYNHQLNFSNLHTYSWGKIQTDNPLWQPRIQQAVDKDLQAKGWQRVDSAGQVTVTAVGAVRNQQEYRTFYDNMGGWRWRGFGTQSTTTVENERIRTLVVDMYDTAQKQLIWRGIATDTLSDDPAKNEKKLNKATDKMFKEFPPKTNEKK
jgi:Domain of unknown function (DUF4136)